MYNEGLGPHFAYFDGHRYNWMLRGDQVVLTDPFSDDEADILDFVYRKLEDDPRLITT